MVNDRAGGKGPSDDASLRLSTDTDKKSPKEKSYTPPTATEKPAVAEKPPAIADHPLPAQDQKSDRKDGPGTADQVDPVFAPTLRSLQEFQKASNLINQFLKDNGIKFSTGIDNDGRKFNGFSFENSLQGPVSMK